MEKLNRYDKKRYKFWVIDKNYIEITQKIEHHHYYGQQVDISVEYNVSDESGLIERLVSKLEEIVSGLVGNYVDDLIELLKKQGYEQLSYYDSDEYIDDYFISNGFEFDEDGDFI